MPSTNNVEVNNSVNLHLGSNNSRKRVAWNARDVSPMELSGEQASINTAFSSLSLNDDIHLLKTILPVVLQEIVIDYVYPIEFIIDILKEGKELPDYLKNYAKNAKYLDLSLYSLSDSQIYELLILFKNIESLKIIEFFKFSDFLDRGSYKTFKTCFKKLSYLDMSGINALYLPDMFLYTNIASNLSYLNISRSSLGSAAIQTLLWRTKRVPEHLNFNYCKKVNDNILDVLKNFLSLKHLELEGCVNITDAGFRNLSEIPSLEYLNVGGLVLDNDHGLSISMCKNLKMLNLSNCKLSESCLFHIGRTEKLEHLDISDCDIGNSAEQLYPLKSLKTLNVSNTSLSQKQIETIKRAIPGITVHHKSAQSVVSPTSSLTKNHNVVYAIARMAKCFLEKLL